MRITNKKELTQKAISEALTDLCFLAMNQDTDARDAKMVMLKAQIKRMEQSLPSIANTIRLINLIILTKVTNQPTKVRT